MDRGFVLTDERLRTNLPNVYAVGDIVPGLQLAHRGFQQGIFVAEEIAGLTRRRSTRRASRGSPTATPRSPPSASPRRRPRSSTAPTRSRRYDYNLGGNGKSQILRTTGFVKLVRAARTGPVVGVHMVGARVGELIGEAQLIVNWEAHPEDVAAAHPRAPDPERGARRGPPRPGRQAAARPR